MGNEFNAEMMQMLQRLLKQQAAEVGAGSASGSPANTVAPMVAGEGGAGAGAGAGAPSPSPSGSKGSVGAGARAGDAITPVQDCGLTGQIRSIIMVCGWIEKAVCPEHFAYAKAWLKFRTLCYIGQQCTTVFKTGMMRMIQEGIDGKLTAAECAPAHNFKAAFEGYHDAVRMQVKAALAELQMAEVAFRGVRPADALRLIEMELGGHKLNMKVMPYGLARFFKVAYGKIRGTIHDARQTANQRPLVVADLPPPDLGGVVTMPTFLDGGQGNGNGNGNGTPASAQTAPVPVPAQTPEVKAQVPKVPRVPKVPKAKPTATLELKAGPTLKEQLATIQALLAEEAKADADAAKAAAAALAATKAEAKAKANRERIAAAAIKEASRIEALNAASTAAFDNWVALAKAHAMAPAWLAANPYVPPGTTTTTTPTVTAAIDTPMPDADVVQIDDASDSDSEDDSTPLAHLTPPALPTAAPAPTARKLEKRRLEFTDQGSDPADDAAAAAAAATAKPTAKPTASKKQKLAAPAPPTTRNAALMKAMQNPNLQPIAKATAALKTATRIPPVAPPKKPTASTKRVTIMP
jgi:hypothetical protein